MTTLTPGFDPERDHWRGGERATVTLLIFGDYQCPFTRMAERVAGRMRRAYSDSLRTAFRHLPLAQIHPRALAAATAAEVAAQQSRFWPMHDVLFANQDHLEDEDLARYAAELGIDPGTFDRHAVMERLHADLSSAAASGARGTPTLFINGRLHAGGYDQRVLAPALEAAGATSARSG